MSGTVMKFGPQWIRTLTDGGAPAAASTAHNIQQNNNQQNSSNTTSSSTTLSASAATTTTSNSSSSNNSLSNNNNSNGGGKYKLAEYRYGREEMLALYEHEMEAPEDIRKYTDLYVEKAHMPMAMTQMSEEELKLSTRNWNSEAVLRSSTGKMAAAAAAAAAGGLGGVGGAGPNSAGGIQGTGGAACGIGSNLIDRDTRQPLDRGAPGALSAAGVLSSSPRGPPGSLSRIPIEQRGLLTSMNTRGPTSIRHLVGRAGPNMFNRSQSHEEEGADDNSGALGGSFENRFGLAGQARQPNSLRARFETNRATAAGASGTKPIDIKNNGTIEGETMREGRSVFDRLPNKYSLEEKNVRKDVNGRMIPGGDWRSRDWSGGGGGAGVESRDPKITTDERSWRSARGGTAEDWRSNNSSNASSSWYVKTDEQRRAGGLNQENLTSSVFSKRDTLRRPSTDEKQGEDDEHPQPRHRRDSLPEWSIGDPLSGDKVGSFDASGAFREVARDEGVAMNNKDKNHDHFESIGKSIGMTSEQEWRSKQQGYAPNSHMNDPRNFNGVDSQTLSELEKLSLSDRNNIPGRDRMKNSAGPDESRSKPSHRSSPSPTENERKKLANSGGAMSDQQQQQQQINQNDDDGFAHLERAAECMVAQWTAEEEQDSQLYLVNKANLNAKQQDAQAEQVASKSFDPNDHKKFLLPFNHEDSQQWFYRDTQGVVQGPFSANEMFEWYKAGYFVKELLVRRACDEVFCQLGEVIKMWDRIPFAPVPVNVPPPHPITPQAILQFRAATKQLELASGMNPNQGQIPPNAFGITHPGAVLIHGPMLQQQQPQQVHQVLAAASLNQNISNPQEQQAGIRQLLEANRQHDQSMAQQRSHQTLDQNEMQTQLRQLLAHLKNREGFANLNPQEQQEVLVRQFIASQPMPRNMPDQEQQALLQGANALPFLPFLSNEERLRYQQRMETDRRQKEEAENQDRFVMEQRMKAEEEKQRIMDEMQNRQRQKLKEESDKQRQEAERILKLSQLKQLQLAKQQEEFRQQQLQNQQKMQQQQQQQAQEQQQALQLQQQQEKKHRQQVNQLNAIQQQQQEQQHIERAKKAAQAQQVHQEQQRKTAWSTVSKPEQEPISLATLQKMQEEEKEKERERQRQIQQQIQRQMTWANAAQQPKAAPVKTLAEIQKEEEERLAREKQKKPKVQAAVPNAGVWNNAASHLSWKNPPADS